MSDDFRKWDAEMREHQLREAGFREVSEAEAVSIAEDDEPIAYRRRER